MKLCRFDNDRLGVVVEDDVVDVTDLIEDAPRVKPWPRPSNDWLIANLGKLRPLIEERVRASAPRKRLASVGLLSPIANPGKIIGAPGNYRAHVDEAVADAGIHHGNVVGTIEHHGLFVKANTSLVGPSQGVTLRFPERRSDYEGELVAVIGSECTKVDERDAHWHIAGYCTGLDMTLRGPEERSLRKSIDSYTVLGPWLTTADEVGEPDDLMIHLELNAETRQYCSTSRLIFGVRKLIAYASNFYTLYPGDVIFTGTPAGVGSVQIGDLIRVAIDKVGAMDVQIR